jgi:pilus assembly protein Flp/PilA
MVKAKLWQFAGDETGATVIEYGLLAALAALAVIASFTLVGNSLVNLFDNGTAETLIQQTGKIP